MEPIAELLDNGLAVCVAPQPHLHKVAIGMFVRAGSRYETEETNGISHLAEHMMFRGTPKYPTRKDFVRAVEVLGGEINAWTTFDMVCYHVEGPSESGQGLLDLLLSLFDGPQFEGFEQEKEVVLEEVRSDLGAKGQDLNAHNIVRRLAFRDPLGFPIAGTLKSVSGLTLDTLREHFDDFYVADNMALVITGNTSGLVPPKTSNLPVGVRYKNRVVPQGPSWQPSALKFVRAAGSALTDVVVSVRTSGSYRTNQMSLQILIRIINGGMSARLEQVREMGLAYESGVELELHDTLGLLSIYASTSKDKVLLLTSTLFSLLRGLADIGDEEFALAKKQVAWDIDSTQDSAIEYLDQLGILAIKSSPPRLSIKRAMLERTTKEDVESKVRDLLEAKSVYVACVGTVSASDKKAIKEIVSVYST